MLWLPTATMTRDGISSRQVTVDLDLNDSFFGSPGSRDIKPTLLSRMTRLIDLTLWLERAAGEGLTKSVQGPIEKKDREDKESKCSIIIVIRVIEN